MEQASFPEEGGIVGGTQNLDAAESNQTTRSIYLDRAAWRGGQKIQVSSFRRRHVIILT